MIHRDHVISAYHMVERTQFHYTDIKLNVHCYSDIASRELSVQLDKSDNCITVNEDAVLNQSLKNKNISKEKWNKDDNQQLCTTQIESTNVDTIDTESDEDTELAEEQIAINHRQDLTGDPLPSVVQFENLENQIYQCAPVENNIPKYILLDNDFEVLAFPDLFPYGSGGYHSANRKVKLPIRKYFQQHLLNVDSRFAQMLNIYLCTVYSRHKNREWCNISHHVILRKNTWRAQDHSWTVMKSSSTRTTCEKWAAYQISEKCQRITCLLARSVVWCTSNAQTLSNPTWFLTLFAADLHWPEMIQAVAVLFRKILSQKRSTENCHCRQKQILMSKPHNWCTNVST